MLFIIQEQGQYSTRNETYDNIYYSGNLSWIDLGAAIWPKKVSSGSCGSEVEARLRPCPCSPVPFPDLLDCHCEGP